MATGGQSETLRRFKELAESVLRVTERLERVMERVEACAEKFEQLGSRADGLQRSRELALDEAYRMLSRQVDELREKVRWTTRTWTWKPLIWGAVGGLIAGVTGSGMTLWVALNPDSPLSRFLLS